MKKLIGLSLSFCVRDILKGDVRIEDVEKIITSCAPDEGGIDPIITDYLSIYWDGFTRDQVMAVIAQVRLEYPRLTVGRFHYPLIDRQRWVYSEDEIVWNDQ